MAASTDGVRGAKRKAPPLSPAGDGRSPSAAVNRAKKRRKEPKGSHGDASKKSDTPKRAGSPPCSAYTVAHFKVDLKDPNTAFAGVQKFVDLCRAFAAEEKATDGETGGYDLAAEYCRSSPDCCEVLRLLEDADKRTDGEVQLIYEALECILLRLASTDGRASTVHWQNTASKTVVESLLGGGGASGAAGGCLRRLYASLSMSRKSVHIKAALRLLAAVVVQGEWAAKEFSLRFDLEHSHVLPLLGRRDAKDPADVRACLLQLIVALVLHSPTAVLRHVLERKRLFGAIFMSVRSDTASSVQMLLATLLDEVVLNPMITKTAKIRIFNETALRHLFGLYRWKGPTAWKSTTGTGRRPKRASAAGGDDEDAGDDIADADVADVVDAEGLRAVRAAVHKLLLTLCCDVKNGINFYDKSLGTSGRNMNHVTGSLLLAAARRQQALAATSTSAGDVLLQLLLHPAAAAAAAASAGGGDEDANDARFDSEADLMDELVSCVLRVCPDQLHTYLSKFQQSLLPRQSVAWLRHVAFLTKLYEELPASTSFLTYTEAISPAKWISIVSVLLTPPAAVMQHFQAAIKRPEIIVRHAALRFIVVLLRRADESLRSVTRLFSDDKEGQLQRIAAVGSTGGSDAGRCDARAELALLLRECLVLRLPEFKAVCVCWTAVTELCAADAAAAATTANAATSDETGVAGVNGSTVAAADYAAVVLEALEGYQSVLPASVAENPPDVASLLHGVAAIKSSAESGAAADAMTVGVRLLRLLGSMRSFGVNALRERGRDQKTALHWLLQLVVSASPSLSNRDDPALRSECVTLLSQLIARTGMFDGLEFELGVWLECAWRRATAAELSHRGDCQGEKSEVAVLPPSLGAKNPPPPHATAVVDYLEKCLLVLISNPYPYLEAVCHYASEQGHDLGWGLPFSPLAVVAVRTLAQPSATKDARCKDESSDHLVQQQQNNDDPCADSRAAVTAFVEEVLLRLLAVQDDPRPLIAFYEREAGAIICDDRTKQYCELLKGCFGGRPGSAVDIVEASTAAGRNKCKQRDRKRPAPPRQPQLSDDFADHVWSVFFEGALPPRTASDAGKPAAAVATSAASAADGDVYGGTDWCNLDEQRFPAKQQLVVALRHVLLGLCYVLSGKEDRQQRADAVEHGFRLVRQIVSRSRLLTPSSVPATVAPVGSGEVVDRASSKTPVSVTTDAASAMVTTGVEQMETAPITGGDGDVADALGAIGDGLPVQQSAEPLRVQSSQVSDGSLIGTSGGGARSSRSCFAAVAATFLQSALVRAWFPLPPVGTLCGAAASLATSVTKSVAAIVEEFGQSISLDVAMETPVSERLVSTVESAEKAVASASWAGDDAGGRRRLVAVQLLDSARAVATTLSLGDVASGVADRLVAAAGAITVWAECSGVVSGYYECARAVVTAVSRELSASAILADARLLRSLELTAGRLVEDIADVDDDDDDDRSAASSRGCAGRRLAALQYACWLIDRVPGVGLPESPLLASALNALLTGAEDRRELAEAASAVIVLLVGSRRQCHAEFGVWLVGVRRLSKSACVLLSSAAAAYLSSCQAGRSAGEPSCAADGAVLRKLEKMYWSAAVQRLVSRRRLIDSVLDVVRGLCHLLRTKQELEELCSLLSAAVGQSETDDASERSLWSAYAVATALSHSAPARRQYLIDVVVRWSSVIMSGLCHEVSRTATELLASSTPTSVLPQQGTAAEASSRDAGDGSVGEVAQQQSREPLVDASFVTAVDGSWKAFATTVLKSHYEDAPVMRMFSTFVSKLYASSSTADDDGVEKAEVKAATRQQSPSLRESSKPTVTKQEGGQGSVAAEEDDGEEEKGDVGDEAEGGCGVNTSPPAPPLQPPPSLPAARLFGMLTGHSKFLAVVLTDPKSRHPSGNAVLDTAYALLLADGAAVRQEHFAVWLGAYDASLSPTDQRLLCLMQLYQKHGVATDKYRPFVWGQLAIERYCRGEIGAGGPAAALSSARRHLLSSDSPLKQILQCIDTERMRRSAIGFPLRRALQASRCHEAVSELGALSADCYDPAFMLPLLSYVFRADQLVDARAAAQNRLLSYPLAALASHRQEVRLAAGHVLLSYRHHLEPARFTEKRQLLWLLTCTQNSLESSGHKLSCIFTAYLVKMVDVLLKPDSHVYGPLCKFLHLRPTFDIANVPEFYKLFNSSDMEYKLERMWMLRLLEDGLRETADYRIYEKRYVFKLLLAFHDSPLSDAATKAQVLAVVKRAVSLRSVAIDLVRQHGLIPWLVATVNGASSARAAEQRSSVLEILQCLWRTMVPASGASPDRSGDEKVLEFASSSPVSPPPPPAWFVAEMAVAASLVRRLPGVGEAFRPTPPAAGVLDAAQRERCSWMEDAVRRHEELLKARAREGHFVQPPIALR